MTNPAAGYVGEPLTHEEVLEAGRVAGPAARARHPPLRPGPAGRLSPGRPRRGRGHGPRSRAHRSPRPSAVLARSALGDRQLRAPPPSRRAPSPPRPPGPCPCAGGSGSARRGCRTRRSSRAARTSGRGSDPRNGLTAKTSWRMSWKSRRISHWAIVQRRRPDMWMSARRFVVMTRFVRVAFGKTNRASSPGMPASTRSPYRSERPVHLLLEPGAQARRPRRRSWREHRGRALELHVALALLVERHARPMAHELVRERARDPADAEREHDVLDGGPVARLDDAD